MTFDEIVREVADRMNLTSDTSIARIGRSVNEKYGDLVSSCGLQTTVRAQDVIANTVIGNREVTFPVDKVDALFNPGYPEQPALSELSYDELKNRIPRSDPPFFYAISQMGANTSTVILDCIPASVYPLSVDGYAQRVVLQDNDIPSFPERFHNLLIYGAISTELIKMEKPDTAINAFNARCAELRQYLAKSAYLVYYQGKTNRGRRRFWL